MDNGTYISVYLYDNTVHIYKSAIKEMQNPKFIRFLVHEDGKSLIMQPYDRKTQTSFKVPSGLFDGNKSMRVYSKKFCKALSQMQGWNNDDTYRVPGKVYRSQRIVMFDLTQAIRVPHGDSPSVVLPH